MLGIWLQYNHFCSQYNVWKEFEAQKVQYMQNTWKLEILFQFQIFIFWKEIVVETTLDK